MTGHTTASEPDRETPPELRGLTPSAKLVAKALEYEGSLTQEQLAESTLLPARTVRSALTRLEEHDLVASRVSLVDARRRIYSLSAADE